MNPDGFFDRPTLRLLRLAAETVQAVGLLVTTTSSAAVLVYLAVRPLIDSELALRTAIGAGASCATVLACRQYRRFRPVPTGYEILELRGELLIERLGDHHRYTYTKEQLIRSGRDDLRLIEIRTHWTGRGSQDRFQIQPLFGHVLLDGGQVEEDHRLYRWIYPGHPVGRGQTLRVGIRQMHQDDLMPQQPYYRDGGAPYVARSLVVVTRFPIAEDPPSVQGETWSSRQRFRRRGRVVAHRREVNLAAGTIDYIVRVQHPRRQCSYGLRWTWPDADHSGKKRAEARKDR